MIRHPSVKVGFHMHVHVYIPTASLTLDETETVSTELLRHRGDKWHAATTTVFTQFLRTLIWQKSYAPSMWSSNLDFKSTTELTIQHDLKSLGLAPGFRCLCPHLLKSVSRAPPDARTGKGLRNGPLNDLLTTSKAVFCFEVDFFFVNISVCFYL